MLHTIRPGTNIKDENKKEICEGDIVLFNNKKHTVVFRNMHIFYLLKGVGTGDIKAKDAKIIELNRTLRKLKIIGNIYDNVKDFRIFHDKKKV